ncbi:MAG: hypothetical protein JO257_16040, partial [Deltaproteobacteria bacterium]|nr:hypothetical protein [Deltaproteobacteria bacterium]
MRLALLVVLVGCGGSHGGKQPDAAPPDVAIDAATVPVFRNPVSLPDNELASQALTILGATGSAQECNACHGLTRQHLRYWRALTDTSMSACLTDLSVATQQSAQQMIDCMRMMPSVSTSDFAPEKLGIAAAAARLPWFQYTFWKAYGDQGATELANFIGQAGMPKDTVPPLTQAQFDIVAEYFARGLPNLDITLPQDPRPSTCTPGISNDVAVHTSALATTGWRAVNRDNMMAMFDCGTATDPKQCLADKSDTTWGVHGTLRLLKDVTYQSSYWTRSSPDGRFVAHGVANVSGSYVLDLQRDATISIATQYDPGFFPDNTGFVFQGGTKNVCAESVLTSNPTSIAMTETGCSHIGAIGLYQHVGRALGGGDYFAIDSEFVSDDGGHVATLQDPDTAFGSHGYFDLTPMMFDGTKYVPKTPVKVATPFEGDSVLSPSSRLVLSRVANPSDHQIGYVLRKVIATPSGSSYTIASPEIARYCFSGGKPAFSYDERWIAFHHYVTSDDAKELGFTGPSDPAFQPYLQKGAANIYVMELTTGISKRVTNMAPG